MRANGGDTTVLIGSIIKLGDGKAKADGEVLLFLTTRIVQPGERQEGPKGVLLRRGPDAPRGAGTRG